jgi:hypothetical protein
MLMKVVETYHVGDEAEAQSLIEAAKNDTSFELIGYSSKIKETKRKGEVIDSYFIVTLTKKMD